MKLLGRKKGGDPAGDTESAVADGLDLTVDSAVAPDGGASGVLGGPRVTPPKGRPTPKRSAAPNRQGKKGPVAPAPMTSAEARARRKSMAGPKLSREERQAEKALRRERMTDRRERMMAGEEGYLLPRDQGPERRFARDVVDARRNVLGLFMPSALALMFVMFGVPQLQLYISPAMLVLMAIMMIDGFILGRKVTGLVDVKFPDNTESRWKLGFYASSRASQLRRMRSPRAQVNRGDRVG